MRYEEKTPLLIVMGAYRRVSGGVGEVRVVVRVSPRRQKPRQK